MTAKTKNRFQISDGFVDTLDIEVNSGRDTRAQRVFSISRSSPTSVSHCTSASYFSAQIGRLVVRGNYWKGIRPLWDLKRRRCCTALWG